MRTKLAFLIGILALMVFTVGAASAEPTFVMTTVNELGDVPAGAEIQIDVTYDAGANQIIFEDNSTGLTDPRITLIAYNDPAVAIAITSYNITGDLLPDATGLDKWTARPGINIDGFGTFVNVYELTNPTSNNHPARVVVTLADFDGEIDPNLKGFEVAAHFVWDSPAAATGATSIKVAGPGEGTIVPSGDIPEFPTIALPVAAIMGIMFLFGRRKTE